MLLSVIRNGMIRIDRIVYPQFLPSVMLIVYISLSFIVGDLSLFISSIKSLLVVFCILSTLFFLDCKQFEKVIMYLSVFWAIQLGYVVLTIIYRSFYEIGSFLRPPSGSHIYDAIAREGTFIRTIPAAGQLVSGLAMVSGVWSITFLTFFLKARGTRHSLIYFLGLISSLAIGVFSGRTSIVVFGAGFLLISAFDNVPKLKLISKITFYFAPSVGFAVILIYIFLPFIFSWAFEPFINLLNGNGLSTKSSNSLLYEHTSRYDSFELLPTFMYKTERGWAAGVDIGYIRYYHFGGVALYLIGFFWFFKLFSSIRGRFHAKNLSFFIVPTAILLLVTFKQETINNASMLGSVVLLAISLAYLSGKGSESK